MVVLPVPGPPVMITAFSDTAAFTAATCFGASRNPTLRWAHDTALSTSTFLRVFFEEIKRLMRTAMPVSEMWKGLR